MPWRFCRSPTHKRRIIVICDATDVVQASSTVLPGGFSGSGSTMHDSHVMCIYTAVLVLWTCSVPQGSAVQVRMTQTSHRALQYKYALHNSHRKASHITRQYTALQSPTNTLCTRETCSIEGSTKHYNFQKILTALEGPAVQETVQSKPISSNTSAHQTPQQYNTLYRSYKHNAYQTALQYKRRYNSYDQGTHPEAEFARSASRHCHVAGSQQKACHVASCAAHVTG
jgi:hypothetical protein